MRNRFHAIKYLELSRYIQARTYSDFAGVPLHHVARTRIFSRRKRIHDQRRERETHQVRVIWHSAAVVPEADKLALHCPQNARLQGPAPQGEKPRILVNQGRNQPRIEKDSCRNTGGVGPRTRPTGRVQDS